MQTWLDIESRFRALVEPLRLLRLDAQWGSAGEHWHLAGIGGTHLTTQFEALVAIAGDMLVRALPVSDQNPDWLADPDSLRRWFRALKEFSRAFQFAHTTWEVDENGNKTGTIYTGSIANFVEVSANFCLNMHSKFPIQATLSCLGVHTKVTNIHLINSQVGVLNSGQLQNVESIDVNLTQLQESGYTDVAEAIKQLTQAVMESQEIQDEDKSIVLEQLEELSRQAVLAPDQRAKGGVLKAVATGVATTLGAAGSLAEVWSTWGPVIMRFFNP